MASTVSAASAPRTSLLRHPAEWRQVGLVLTYQSLLWSMFLVPWCRNPVFFVLACGLSFLNAVVIHNHLHSGIFRSRDLNMIWRVVLSFGNLYPASANIASHNLVHHHFDDDGDRDWADPRHVAFRWNLLNLIHFPNVAGPYTFEGVTRWAATTRQEAFVRQYQREKMVAFGLTGLLLVLDFWTALLFVVVPQLWGARGILRINLIQHDRTDITSEWNHSRNFVGRAFNWLMCNNGYHTIHHNRAGLHWSELAEAHRREAVPHLHPSLDEPSMVGYLWRTYVVNFERPATRSDLATVEVSSGARHDAASLPSRADRRTSAAHASEREQLGSLTTAPVS